MVGWGVEERLWFLSSASFYIKVRRHDDVSSALCPLYYRIRDCEMGISALVYFHGGSGARSGERTIVEAERVPMCHL